MFKVDRAASSVATTRRPSGTRRVDPPSAVWSGTSRTLMVFRHPLPMQVGDMPFVAVSCLTIYECVVDVEDVELVSSDWLAGLGGAAGRDAQRLAWPAWDCSSTIRYSRNSR
jgi:hypothetical protein